MCVFACVSLQLRVSQKPRKSSSPMVLEPTSPPPPGEEPSRGEQLYTYRIRSLTAMCVDDDFSVRMAQRVLQLERINAALRRDTEAERAQSKKLQEEVMKKFLMATNVIFFKMEGGVGMA